MSTSLARSLPRIRTSRASCTSLVTFRKRPLWRETTTSVVHRPGLIPKDAQDDLMAAIFPPAAWDQAYVAALVPFDLVSVYETPAFRRDLLGDDRHVRGRLNLDTETMRVARLRFAYKVVLERVYGIRLDLDDAMHEMRIIRVADTFSALRWLTHSVYKPGSDELLAFARGMREDMIAVGVMH